MTKRSQRYFSVSFLALFLMALLAPELTAQRGSRGSSGGSRGSSIGGSSRPSGSLGRPSSGVSSRPSIGSSSSRGSSRPSIGSSSSRPSIGSSRPSIGSSRPSIGSSSSRGSSRPSIGSSSPAPTSTGTTRFGTSGSYDRSSGSIGAGRYGSSSTPTPDSARTSPAGIPSSPSTFGSGGRSGSTSGSDRFLGSDLYRDRGIDAAGGDSGVIDVTESARPRIRFPRPYSETIAGSERPGATSGTKPNGALSRLGRYRMAGIDPFAADAAAGGSSEGIRGVDSILDRYGRGALEASGGVQRSDGAARPATSSLDRLRAAQAGRPQAVGRGASDYGLGPRGRGAAPMTRETPVDRYRPSAAPATGRPSPAVAARSPLAPAAAGGARGALGGSSSAVPAREPGSLTRVPPGVASPGRARTSPLARPGSAAATRPAAAPERVRGGAVERPAPGASGPTGGARRRLQQQQQNLRLNGGLSSEGQVVAAAAVDRAGIAVRKAQEVATRAAFGLGAGPAGSSIVAGYFDDDVHVSVGLGGFYSNPYHYGFTPFGLAYHGSKFSFGFGYFGGWGSYWSSPFYCYPFYTGLPVYFSAYYPYYYYYKHCYYPSYYYPPLVYSSTVYTTSSYDDGPEVVYVEVPADEQPVEYVGEAAAPPVQEAAQPAFPGAGIPEVAGADDGSLNSAAERYLELGDDAFREGRYGDAVQFYAKSIELAPDVGVLYLVLSDALFATGDYHYAAYTIRRALKLDPALASSGVDKHTFYSDPQEFDRQLAVLEQYVLDHPTDGDARLVLATNYLFGNRPAEAVDLLEGPFSSALLSDTSAVVLLEAARAAQFGE